MELHQKLTILGIVLLVATFLIHNYHDQTHPEEFNFAYITGIAMLIVFSASFILFNKNKMGSKNKKS